MHRWRFAWCGLIHRVRHGRSRRNARSVDVRALGQLTGGRSMNVHSGASREFVFTSESVSEGHPDKVCDLIADTILDAHLAGDRNARVACEVLCKGGDVVLAGEITSAATVDVASIARDVIRRIGYTDCDEPFNADGVSIRELITLQAGEIGHAVLGAAGALQGAGDQGLMFGYATEE